MLIFFNYYGNIQNKQTRKFSHIKTRYKIHSFFTENTYKLLLLISVIMSNNFQSDKAFGKCCYVESGERCGCQRFIALENNEKTCEACYHHSSYHEDLIKNNANRLLNNSSSLNELYSNSTTTTSSNNRGAINIDPNTSRQRVSTLDELYSPYNSNITSGTSMLNQLLSGRALEEQSIANELNETFTRNKNHLSTSTSSTMPSMRRTRPNFDSVLSSNYYNSNRNKRRKNLDAKIKETCITVIVLPDIGDELQTPIISQPM
jgi:hypothetical protein